MALVVRFGAQSSATLELSSEALVAVCQAPRGTPFADVAAAVDRALAEPLEFPPLAQSVVPGDKVVLALAPGVPQGTTIVHHTLAALRGAGIEGHDITLLRTQDDVDAGLPDPLAALPRELTAGIHGEVHDPRRREALSYLAADAGAKPIYINRTLHEADSVIAIGCLRLEESPGNLGMHGGVFPVFSDAARLDRYRTPAALEPTQRRKLQKQSDEVGWLLGLQFTIQVVPGAESEVLHVLAGNADAVFREGHRLCQEAWSFEIPQLVDLAVATIEGDAHEQTWANVGRALAAATRATRPGGAVVVCTELEEGLGAALEMLVGAADLDEALSEIQQQHPADALVATQIAQALEHGKIYLISQLDDELVEELGVAPLGSEQLSRIAQRYESCLVLTNAQYAVARPPVEETTLAASKRKSRR
jgi:hypothetical protein